jgi:predicted flap endonuclease-1-like 5' DNA nuclease
MSYKIEKIEGIGPAYAAKLTEQGIKTTADYLAKAADAKGRKALAEATSISPALILRWANQADLMRITGVGEEFAELLEKAGVDTVKELKMRNAQNLTAAMDAVNAEKKLVRRIPNLSEVEKWIEQAKTLEPMISH